MNIELSPHILERLEKEAARREQTMEETANLLLDQYLPLANPATLADLARSARALGLATKEPVNTAERSREILNAEFADWVDRRVRQR